MEKKSIGRFIAALRKANGMTQRDLAEQLNVSDKAVSRWERDESAPDLSLIPVIAEIFGVTSDEILRGERVGYQEPASEKNSEKGQKQIALLLNKSKTRFQMLSLISLGIVGVGLLGAMICNFGFLRAQIGFFVGCIFLLAAVICESIFFLTTIASVHIEDAEGNAMADCKGYIRKWFVGTITAIGSAFAFCLPLITETWDTYMGLNMEYWFPMGLLFALVVAAVGTIIIWALSASKKSDLFTSSEETKEASRIKLSYVKKIAVVMLITFVVQYIVNAVATANNYFAQGKVFETYDDFVAFMEMEAYEEGNYVDEFVISVEIQNINTELVDIPTDDAEQKKELLDADGNVLCSYVCRNETVSMIDYGKPENGYLPITVYTSSQLRQGYNIMENLINPCFYAIYVIEILGGIFIYFRRKNNQ